ncbi:hypothetical protein FDECE_16698 [Fusarium decemcellulare]|nr:hypothetical protein FDECE_16698 [Fusarium decemcellulare]
MAARPSESYQPTSGSGGVARLPRHLEARGGSSSRTASSSSQSSFSPQTNIQYEASIMSDDSYQKVADALMSLRYELRDMSERLQDLIDLRKRLSHRAKKVNDAEYEQALNSPSMLVLYQVYKDAHDHATSCKRAVDERMREFSNKFTRATEEDQLEVYALQEIWVKASIE